MFVVKYCNDPEPSEANFHAIAQPFKTVAQNIHLIMLASFFFTYEEVFTVNSPKKNADKRLFTHIRVIHQSRRKT